MPELPEVERAASLVRSVAIGRRITRVETAEDTIVYSDTTHELFATEITGRVVKNCARYGKVFYLELEGPGKMPVLHLGMTGMRNPSQGRTPHVLPQKAKGGAYTVAPTFYEGLSMSFSGPTPFHCLTLPSGQFILHFTDKKSGIVTELAFIDARRLARIRLCASPLTEPPISNLGFDPILSMPPLDDAFSALLLKRKMPVKALLLDQSFSAGVGNWVADEILYHARVHPEQKSNTLTTAQISALHAKIISVCTTAVAANADDTLFPEDWLFKHRWGKGKKAKHNMKLPSGEPATIKFAKVGGRTSAYVVELQHLTSGSTKEKHGGEKISDSDEDADSDTIPCSDPEAEDEKAKAKNPKKKRKAEVIVESSTSELPTRRSKRAKTEP